MLNRIGSAVLLAIFLPSLASAYCGVRINGKWMYSGGTCADWNDYAKNSGDQGFACFNFGVADEIVRNSPTSVQIETPSGRGLPLGSDAMQRAFNKVARQALTQKPPKRIVIRDDHGVISNRRLALISKETGARIVNARRGRGMPPSRQPTRQP
jgi:hypothetical protein